MTSSPSDTETAVNPLQDYADRVAEVTGGEASLVFGTVKVRVAASDWTSVHLKARDELGLVFFSWLSGIDWANDVAAGDALSEEVDERIELLTTVSDISEGHRVTFSTDLDHDSPSVSTLIEVYAGADWHEREAAEMFGIDFDGHPNLEKLYLPEAFVGTPLRKSFPLLSREVKPWPGTVDVEAMPEKDEGPSTENPEA